MRAFLLPAAAFAFFAMLPIGLAATASGTVKSVNSKGDAITLDDGEVFVLAEGTEAESVKVGTKVKITFSMKSGKMVATKVEASK
jgi:hypothetical protein